MSSPSEIVLSQRNQVLGASDQVDGRDVPHRGERSGLKILHVDNIIGETCASYNEHVLARTEDDGLSICSYFPSPIEVPDRVSIFAGKGTVSSFYRQFFAALRAQTCDAIHVHAPHVGVLVWLGLLLAQPRRLKSVVYTVHSCFPNYSRLHRLLLVPVFAGFGRIVHCSQSSFESFPGFYRWLGGRRRCAIPNGVDIARVDRLLLNEKKDTDTFTIVVVGRLMPVKNMQVLIRAFANAGLDRAQLRIVGDGPERARLEELIVAEGLGHVVTLTGLIPRDEVYLEMKRADLMVSASWVEGLPIAVLEAMTCGCPVILSKIPAHQELAREICEIPLVEPSDTHGWTEAILMMEKLDVTKRTQLGHRCRELVRDRFSLEAMHDHYTNLYIPLSSPHPNT